MQNQSSALGNSLLLEMGYTGRDVVTTEQSPSRILREKGQGLSVDHKVPLTDLKLL